MGSWILGDVKDHPTHARCIQKQMPYEQRATQDHCSYTDVSRHSNEYILHECHQDSYLEQCSRGLIVTEERVRGGSRLISTWERTIEYSNDRHEDNSTERLKLRTLVTAVCAILREKRVNKWGRFKRVTVGWWGKRYAGEGGRALVTCGFPPPTPYTHPADMCKVRGHENKKGLDCVFG